MNEETGNIKNILDELTARVDFLEKVINVLSEDEISKIIARLDHGRTDPQPSLVAAEYLVKFREAPASWQFKKRRILELTKEPQTYQGADLLNNPKVRAKYEARFR